MLAHPPLAWRHITRMELGIGYRSVPVPAPVTESLTQPGGIGVTRDPAADLVRLEHHLRLHARAAAIHVDQAAHRVTSARVATATCPRGQGW